MVAHGERRRKILEIITKFFRRAQLKEEYPVARDRAVRAAAQKIIKRYRKDLEELAKY